MDGIAQELVARLRQNPSDGAALASLRTHCENNGDFATWAACLSEWANAQQNEFSAADGFVELAHVQTQRLGDAQGAQASLEHALSRVPAHTGAAQALRELLLASRDHKRLVEVLERHARALAEAEGDPIELGAIHFELGNLWRDHFKRVDRAVAHYKAAIDFDAAQRAAIAAARDIYAQSGKWDQVVRLLSLEAESHPPGPKQAALMHSLGKVLLERLEDQTGAANAWREAVKAAPDDLNVQHELATLLLDMGDAAGDSEGAALHDEAADVLCNMAKQVDPDYALAYAESALGSAPGHEQALQILTEAARALGREDVLPGRWVAYLEARPAGSMARELRLELARAYIEAGQKNDARVCLQALLEAGDDEAAALLSESLPPSARESQRPAAAHEAETLDDDAFEEVDADDLLQAEPSSADDDLAALTRADRAARKDDTDRQRALSDAVADELSGGSGSHADLDDDAAAMDAAEPGGLEALLEGDDTPESGAPILEQVEEDTTDMPPEALQAAAEQSARLDEIADDDDDELPTADHSDLDVPGEATPVSAHPQSELVALRDQMQQKLRFRDRRGAAQLAETVLGHDPSDAEAIGILEDFYRFTRDWEQLRQLMLQVSRVQALPVDARLQRLREAARLCESKLKDTDGAIQAWRAIAALSPNDEEAADKLRALLTEGERWDDLAQLLERTASVAPDTDERVALYRDLALVHRDKRGSADDAIEAYLYLRDLDPANKEDEVALSELFVQAQRWAEGAAVFESRLEFAEGDDQVTLTRRLAEIYEQHLQDDERAYSMAESLLDLVPGDGAALDQLERLDLRLERYDRLVNVLQTRAELMEGPDRADVHRRAAEMASEQLKDLNLACGQYEQALEAAPGDEQVLHAAGEAFTQAEREGEFTDILVRQVEAIDDLDLKVTVLRQIAARRTRSGELPQAIEALEAALSLRDDPEGLAQLVDLLEQTADSPARLAACLQQMAGLTEDTGKKRDALYRRAELLSSQLDDPQAAKADLRSILDDIDGSHEPSLALLSEVCRSTGELDGLADTLERWLKLSQSPEQQVDLAQELADLFEGEVPDADRAIAALQAWTEADLTNHIPHQRLVPLLEQAERYRELVSTLDTLATLAPEEEEAGELMLRAANVAQEKLQDYDAAWRRLVPRVTDIGDLVAEEALRQLAEEASRGEQLAEIFVGLAQREKDASKQTQRWLDAAQTYEAMVDAPDKALEATLRALALDLDNATLLDEADRLAGVANAWDRLGKVYDALAKRAGTPEARVRVLTRHATLLEEQAGNLSAAYDRIAIASSLAPNDDELLARAEQLATRAERGQDLLAVYERRASAAADVDARIDALMKNCALCQHALEDTPRATGYLARAVDACGANDERLDLLEARVASMDEEHPPIDGRGLKHALTDVYKQRAEEHQREVEIASGALLRAARLFSEELDDERAAFDALSSAAELNPSNGGVLDKLIAQSKQTGLQDELSTHLQQIADDAIDSRTASGVLERLGLLLEGPCEKPDQAADVYKQLLLLRPKDADAAARLRACLTKAGRHQELLVAVDQHLPLYEDEQERLQLLKEAAVTWEEGLNNRYEALDAWKKVQRAAPDDEEARAAVQRLSAREAVDERSLLESGLVVLPEDLVAPDRPAPEPAPEDPEPAADAKPGGPPEAEATDAADAADEDATEEAAATTAGSDEDAAAAPEQGAPEAEDEAREPEVPTAEVAKSAEATISSESAGEAQEGAEVHDAPQAADPAATAQAEAADGDHAEAEQGAGEPMDVDDAEVSDVHDAEPPAEVAGDEAERAGSSPSGHKAGAEPAKKPRPRAAKPSVPLPPPNLHGDDSTAKPSLLDELAGLDAAPAPEPAPSPSEEEVSHVHDSEPPMEVGGDEVSELAEESPSGESAGAEPAPEPRRQAAKTSPSLPPPKLRSDDSTAKPSLLDELAGLDAGPAPKAAASTASAGEAEDDVEQLESGAFDLDESAVEEAESEAPSLDALSSLVSKGKAGQSSTSRVPPPPPRSGGAGTAPPPPPQGSKVPPPPPGGAARSVPPPPASSGDSVPPPPFPPRRE